MAGDVREARDSVAPMDDDLSAVERAVSAMAPKLEEVRDGIDRLRTDLAGLPFVGKS